MTGLDLEMQDFVNKDKAQIKDIANKVTIQINDGYIDPVDMLIFTKKLSELAKELDAKIRPIAESKPIGKEYQKFGVKITEGMQGVKYDFDACNSPVYERSLKLFDDAKGELDSIKEQLKTITKPLEVYDPETSELFVCKPPVKSGKLGFTLTVK